MPPRGKKGKGKQRHDDAAWAAADAAHALASELAISSLTAPLATGTFAKGEGKKKKKKKERQAAGLHCCRSCTFVNDPGAETCIACGEPIASWESSHVSGSVADNILQMLSCIDVWDHIYSCGFLSPRDLASLSAVSKLGYETAHAITTMRAVQTAHLASCRLTTLLPAHAPPSTLLRSPSASFLLSTATATATASSVDGAEGLGSNSSIMTKKMKKMKKQMKKQLSKGANAATPSTSEWLEADATFNVSGSAKAHKRTLVWLCGRLSVRTWHGLPAQTCVAF